MECNAHAKSTGVKCTRKAMSNGKCYVHGGATPRGIASASFKTGRYSKAMPAPLQEAYQRSRSDTELLAHADEIALVDAMIISALPKLETRESGKAWEAIKRNIADLRKAFANEDYGRCLVTVDEMVDVVNERMLYYATEDELRNNIEQRRKLVESEQKRRVAMQLMVDSDDALSLVTALLQSVRENVSDRDTLSAIQDTFTRLTVGLRQSQLIEQSTNE